MCSPLPLKGCTGHSRTDLLARLLGQDDPRVDWYNKNQIKDGAGGVKTFGEINLDGPNPGAGGLHTLGLRFKFVNHVTGLPVTIKWMQFSIFDFDHTDWPMDGSGQEARATAHRPPCESHPFTRTHAFPGAPTRFAVRDSQGIRRLRALRKSRHYFSTRVNPSYDEDRKGQQQ